MPIFSWLYLLGSLTELIRLESACLARGVAVQVEPVPPGAHAGCSMCVAVCEGDAPWVEAQLALWGYAYERIARGGG